MTNKHLVTVVLTAVVSLGLFWLPFKLQANSWLGIDFSNSGMNRIVQNFDGINFLVVAKTWYDPKLIEGNYQDVLVGRRSLYFAAHYPGLPALIALFDLGLNGPNSLLAAIVASNILMAISIYYFSYVFTKKPSTALWITIIALFFPARMLADRAVGSNEPLFIFFILMSLAFNKEKKHILSAVTGSMAVLTRSPGILLFGAYGIQALWESGTIGEKIKKLTPYLLIPLSLLGLWLFYGSKFGSFWAYFQVGGNLNIYLPFSVFTSHRDWISGIWNEDIIYLFGILLTGIWLTWKRNKNSAVEWFMMLYGGFVMCVAHRDLARYSLPIMPIVVMNFVDLINSQIVKIILIIMLIPIFMYAWQFVLANYQPIMNWASYL